MMDVMDFFVMKVQPTVYHFKFVEDEVSKLTKIVKDMEIKLEFPKSNEDKITDIGVTLLEDKEFVFYIFALEANKNIYLCRYNGLNK